MRSRFAQVGFECLIGLLFCFTNVCCSNVLCVIFNEYVNNIIICKRSVIGFYYKEFIGLANIEGRNIAKSFMNLVILT